MSGLVVNKSGTNLPVYNLGGSQIGTIFKNEAYVLLGETLVNGKPGAGIRFLNSSGSVVAGGIATQKEPYMRSVALYPYTTKYECSPVFKLRRKAQLYDYNGDPNGTLAAGTLVWAGPSVLGTNKKYCCQIFGYLNSAGEWKRLKSKNGALYRYIDFGLAYGSYNSNITMYGSW